MARCRCRFRCRRGFETRAYRRRQNHNAMYMIGHNDKGIQRNVWIMPGQPVPYLLYHSAIYVQSHFMLHNFAEQVRPSMRAGGYEIRTRPRIIVTAQAAQLATVLRISVVCSPGFDSIMLGVMEIGYSFHCVQYSATRWVSCLAVPLRSVKLSYLW